MSNTIYNGSYPSIAENYVYSSTGTSKVKTKSDAGSNTAKTSDTASIKDTSTVNNTKADGKVAVNGQTIGNPRLSEKASKYYDQLKKKYSNMNFILVSEDQKEYAKAQASNYANANNMVVLIDEDKIERMAEDENYRKQYEGIIANAASGLSQLGQSIAATGANVKGYGMQVNDGGTASFFAVLKKSGAAQKERIAKKAEQKKEAKKAMGVSPITGIIYYGTLRGDEWVGEKEDVTDMAIRAVFDWFIEKHQDACPPDGVYTLEFLGEDYVLSMKRKDSEIFEKPEKSKLCPRCGAKVQM